MRLERDDGGTRASIRLGRILDRDLWEQCTCPPGEISISHISQISQIVTHHLEHASS